MTSKSSSWRSTFRSLHYYNYRLWASGAIVSNIGTWMQRTALDWLVLTHLTHNNATALGLVLALQFGPQALLAPITGFTADRFDRRTLLLMTQTTLGLLALVLGILIVTEQVQLWQVYILAFLQGCTAAFDAPARQTFVSELVPEKDITNAVALNSTSFNTARMIGPAVAGVMISLVDLGWVFLINAASFIAPIIALSLLQRSQFQPITKAAKSRGGFIEGFRYVRRRADLKILLIMLFLIGTFGMNFALFISTMSVTVFRVSAHEYGLLTSMMALGSVTGALLSAKREKPRMELLLRSSLLFGLGLLLAAFMPNYYLFGVLLIFVGLAAQTFTTSANGLIQLSTEPQMRGRVIAIYMAIAVGGTPIGAPIVGWVADTFGARQGILVGAMAGFASLAVGLYYLKVRSKLALKSESV